MSHHNDICKKCYENINGCTCYLREEITRNQRPLRIHGCKRPDKVERLIARLGQKDIPRKQEEDGIPEE